MLSDQDLRQLQSSGQDADRLKVAKHYIAKGDLSSASSLLDQLCYNTSESLPSVCPRGHPSRPRALGSGTSL